MTWRRIVEFRLVTADLDRAERFYAALGFVPGDRAPIAPDEMALLEIPGGGTRQSFALGPSRLAIDLYQTAGRPYPPGAGGDALIFQHLALVCDAADAAWAKARAAGAVPISRSGPVTLPATAGGVTAMKFRDPDGHPLELLQFPDGAAKGWPGRGLLGIDHSALSVSDVAASRRFYAAHGLVEGHPSLNHGPTQEALDGLDGVRVEVVPLDPPETPPHVELLGYLSPKGRAFGPIAANDIAADRIVWQAGRRELIRDPDGHLHQLEP